MTTFNLRLPINILEDVDIAKEAPASKSNLLKIMGDHKFQGTFDDVIEEKNIPGNKKKIMLVAEDDDDLRKIISSLFSYEFNSIEAENGIEAFNLAKEHVPDIIICDIMMPGMDGIELCKLSKKDEITSHIPFVLLTAKSGEADRVLGYETGADSYVTKPFSTKHLKALVHNLIKTLKKLIFCYQVIQ